jgi:hypothetical protein
MTTIPIDNTDEVLSHADEADEESQGYITNAIKHVHNNPVRTVPCLIRG